MAERDPNLLYPADYFGPGLPPEDDAGYPQGGPYAALKQPFPKPSTSMPGGANYVPKPAPDPAKLAALKAWLQTNGTEARAEAESRFRGMFSSYDEASKFIGDYSND